MTNEFIFKLKKPIAFPVSLYDNQGVIVYNHRDFALGYNTIPNPREKELTVSLIIYRLSDEQPVRNLNTFNITKKGFPTGVILNQKKIDRALTTISDLQNRIEEGRSLLQTLSIQEADLISIGEDASEIFTQILAVNEELNTNVLLLQEQVVPEPELEYANKYSDVIDYFDKDGSITPEGILWARTIPFMGETLNDYLL